MKMPFGKWKDKQLIDIPMDYLIWLRDKTELRQPLKDGVDEAIATLKGLPALYRWEDQWPPVGTYDVDLVKKKEGE